MIRKWMKFSAECEEMTDGESEIMSMKKNILWILLDLVFLAIFNTVFFLLGGAEHPASVWISYGFIHFAYLMVLVTPFLIRESSSEAVFGFALYSVSTVYFLVEFVVGLVFIFVKSDSYKAALVIQIIIAGIYAACLISNIIANESTADKAAQHEAEAAYIMQAAAAVKPLIGKMNSEAANKKVEHLYNVLHSSPTKSSTMVQTLEADIERKIALLRKAATDGCENEIIAISEEATALIEERNEVLKSVQ